VTVTPKLVTVVSKPIPTHAERSAGGPAEATLLIVRSRGDREMKAGALVQRFSNTSAIALIAASVGACSSSPSAAPPPPGTLPPGTAQVTINGHALPESHVVKCVPINAFTTITVGDNAAGVKAFVSNATALHATSVSISDLGGFTGSYDEGLQGAADVTLHGYTYTIHGRADGFDTDNPSFRAPGTFFVKVSC
jgi:lipoprotein LpqH